MLRWKKNLNMLREISWRRPMTMDRTWIKQFEEKPQQQKAPSLWVAWRLSKTVNMMKQVKWEFLRWIKWEAGLRKVNCLILQLWNHLSRLSQQAQKTHRRQRRYLSQQGRNSGLSSSICCKPRRCYNSFQIKSLQSNRRLYRLLCPSAAWWRLSFCYEELVTKNTNKNVSILRMHHINGRRRILSVILKASRWTHL